MSALSAWLTTAACSALEHLRWPPPFPSVPQAGTAVGFDSAQFQALMDHDNHSMRAQMKEFMKQDIYIPWVHALAFARASSRPVSCSHSLCGKLQLATLP